MGSYCTLRFDDFEVWWSKSTVTDVLISLFQEADRREFREEDSEDEEEATSIHTIYATKRANVLQRLNLMGFTSEAASKAFVGWLTGEREMYREWVEEEGYD